MLLAAQVRTAERTSPRAGVPRLSGLLGRRCGGGGSPVAIGRSSGGGLGKSMEVNVGEDAGDSDFWLLCVLEVHKFPWKKVSCVVTMYVICVTLYGILHGYVNLRVDHV